ncbi:MAG TPA: hypothetical protein VGO22_01710 [Pseudorhizobium sp.]|jgi:acyl-CoA reductase-like NAD-dependent aldehyde dehydrogenase|nr:hypothetical protein [Pseudorhizobium sp.]
MTSTSAFISELIKAANQVESLTKPERARLMERAARTIQEQRDQITFIEAPANDNGLDDPVLELREMARLIDIFSATTISSKMMQAVQIIIAGEALLQAKEENPRGDD